MSSIFVSILILAALAAWLVISRRNAGPRASHLPAKKPAQPPAKTKAGKPRHGAAPAKPHTRKTFKAASINPGSGCCQAAASIAGIRFLTETAPRLPLESCDRIASCSCKYHNHPDRRSQEDRRNVYGSLSTVGEIGMRVSNARSGMDRRAVVEKDLDDIDFS